MTSNRKYAEIAAAALGKMLPPGTDSQDVADIVESILADATREHEEGERQHVAAVAAAAEIRLARLLDASPAVIYAFDAKGNFSPTFVSDNIQRLFGYAPSEYLENPDFWRRHVHPEDLPRVEGEMASLFKEGRRAVEYRFRRKDGSYCWVNDDQHLVRDANGEPDEIVGSWSDITRAHRRRGRGGGGAPAARAPTRKRAGSDLFLQGQGRLRADLHQRERQAAAWLLSRRISEGLGVLAGPRPSRRHREGRGRAGPAVRAGAAHRPNTASARKTASIAG